MTIDYIHFIEFPKHHSSLKPSMLWVRPFPRSWIVFIMEVEGILIKEWMVGRMHRGLRIRNHLSLSSTTSTLLFFFHHFLNLSAFRWWQRHLSLSLSLYLPVRFQVSYLYSNFFHYSVSWNLSFFMLPKLQTLLCILLMTLQQHVNFEHLTQRLLFYKLYFVVFL